MANMFKCVLAGGGDGASLIVTCTQNFAGSTITLTNGTKTYTQVCPLSSPYEVTFESVATGVWTVSGIAQGQTFSTSVTITDFEALLADIPEGSTAIPTDDVQTWLHCANIWDKSYTTIAQVLNDASTLQALIASNNAADYMARSTSWASNVTASSSAMSYIGLNDYCADSLLADSTWLNAICNSTYFESVLNVKVPTMTNNTTPSGKCFASTELSATFAAWKAFDGIVANLNHWESNAGITGYLGYQFTQNVNVYKLGLSPDGYASGDINGIPKDFYLECSDDGNTWQRYNNMFTNSNPIANQFNWFINHGNLGGHAHWRINILNNVLNSGALKVGEMRMYGRASL